MHTASLLPVLSFAVPCAGQAPANMLLHTVSGRVTGAAADAHEAPRLSLWQHDYRREASMLVAEVHESHPVGRFKAQFFTRLGYSQDEWESLATDLERHALEGESRELDPSPYGRKFETRGRLVGPTGRVAELISIWIILVGTGAPRFVTAFPG
ncbi:MAG TPA: hypothetical protein VFZ65_16860 [Planctomycetota bacterium]|nr:hypothetical protein [Planctomycetota bacterium]